MFFGDRTLGFLLSRCTGPRRNPWPHVEKIGPSLEHKSNFPNFQSEICPNVFFFYHKGNSI